MQKKGAPLLLGILISSFLLLLPTYSGYTDFSETTLFHVDLNFENPDKDDQLDGQQHESGALSSSISSIAFLPGMGFIEQSHFHSFPFTFHSQDKPILRC